MMMVLIYSLGVFGFLNVEERYWRSLLWPIYIGEMAARQYQKGKKSD